MSRVEWIRKRLEPAVAQGFGYWLEQTQDPDLGYGIYTWKGGIAVQVFEAGVTYDGYQGLRFCFEKMIGLEPLDLRSLMMANKTPDQWVEFAILNVDGRYVLQVPLLLYTTLFGVLNDILYGFDLTPRRSTRN